MCVCVCVCVCVCEGGREGGREGERGNKDLCVDTAYILGFEAYVHKAQFECRIKCSIRTKRAMHTMSFSIHGRPGLG